MGIRSVLLPLLIATLLLSGCAAPAAPAAPNAAPPLELIAELGIDTSSPRSVIEGLDTLPVERRPAPDALVASVRSGELLLQPGNVSLPLDNEGFYLSLAPYVSATHPCEFHSLTTCLGELQNTPVELTVTDAASGVAEIQRSTITADNGFVGVWLPRDREFIVKVVAEQGVAETRVSTGGDDPTCLTTLQLKA